MKRLPVFLVLIALSVAPITNAQIGHELRFTIKNFGIDVDGAFEESSLEGVINLISPEQTNLKAILDVKSINTGNDTRDSHLLEDDYFDAVNHPRIVFETTAFKAIDKINYELRGRLSIKGTTKEVVIPFELGQSGNLKTLSGSLSINRRDFGVGGGSFILSKTVRIYLNIEIPGI